MERTLDRSAASLQRPIVVLAVSALALAAVVMQWNGADPDLFARVAAGRIVEQTGSVATTDPFAFTPRMTKWVDHEWLSGVVFYQVSQWGGDKSLFLFKILIMLASLAALSAAQRRQAPKSPAILPWLLLTSLPAVYVWKSTVRSQVFTYFFLPVFLFVLVSYRRDCNWRRLMILPPLMLVWANVHGGFVVGLGFLGIFAMSAIFDGSRFALPAWGAVVACTAATLVNPYGLDYWAYMANAITMARPTISEWQSVSPLSPAGAILLAYLAFFAVGYWRSGRSAPLEAVVMVGMSCFFAFRSLRLAAIFFMVLAVYGTDSFEALLNAAAERWASFYVAIRRVLTAYVGVGVVTLSAIVLLFAARFERFALDFSFYPVESLEWLQSNRRSGNLLVGFNYGSYALWRLYPRFKVSMDGRYEEVYPASTVDAVRAALDPSAPTHAAAFQSIAPDFVLVPYSLTGTPAPVDFGPSWEIIHQDEDFLLFGKRDVWEDNPSREAVRRPMWRPDF